MASLLASVHVPVGDELLEVVRQCLATQINPPDARLKQLPIEDGQRMCERETGVHHQTALCIHQAKDSV